MTTRRRVPRCSQQGWIATEPGALAEADAEMMPNEIYGTICG